MFIKLMITYLLIALLVSVLVLALSGEPTWCRAANAIKWGFAWPVVLLMFVWMLIIDGAER